MQNGRRFAETSHDRNLLRAPSPYDSPARTQENRRSPTQLEKFNIQLDSAAQISKLMLGEEWEGMSLVPANDPAHPSDYFLFVANDNDFLTSAGTMVVPDGTLVTYNAFAAHPADRIPGAVGDATDPTNNEYDTLFMVFRVTVPEPGAVVSMTAGAVGLAILGRRRSRAGRSD